ncbi:MAG: serralysin, partial [Porticoccaceae bacterium]|nr:serralysin [Porticoccaceae bacterium]
WKCIASGKTSPLLIAPIKGAALAAGMDGQLTSLEQLVNLCGLVYQGRNDIDDIVPSSHRSSDLDGRKPNLVISLFSDSDVGNNDFLAWYRSDNTSRVGNWQRRIAASDAIFQAHHSIEYWLEKAIQLVPIIPDQLQDVAHALIISVQHRAVVKQQGQIA